MLLDRLLYIEISIIDFFLDGNRRKQEADTGPHGSTPAHNPVPRTSGPPTGRLYPRPGGHAAAPSAARRGAHRGPVGLHGGAQPRVRLRQRSRILRQPSGSYGDHYGSQADLCWRILLELAEGGGGAVVKQGIILTVSRNLPI